MDDALLTEPERALAGAVATAEQAVASALASDDFAAALSQLAALRAPIDGFFADVMVMDEDAALRDNRLRLLNRFVPCSPTWPTSARWLSRNNAGYRSQPVARGGQGNLAHPQRESVHFQGGGRYGLPPFHTVRHRLQGGRPIQGEFIVHENTTPLPTIHVVSDSVGLTAQALARAAAARSASRTPTSGCFPMCARSRRSSSSSPSTASCKSPERRREPAIFYTLVDGDLRRSLSDYCESLPNVVAVDL